MKRIFIILLLLQFSFLSFSQTNETIVKGVAVDSRKNPLDVFSLVVVNAQDTTEQVYANTFTDGKFEFRCKTDPNTDYRMYVLSMGYEDTYYILDAQLDTVVMRNRLVKLDDATVKGKRSVTSALGKEGGVMYDVSNTSISDMGSSVALLNYIPGLKVSLKGEVELLGGVGTVVVYINNVKVEDNQKLLSLRSEDIKTVEVLRSPGARYKDAEHVVLITTNRPLDGFGTRMEMAYTRNYHNLDGYAPNIDLSYTKNKISFSASYYLYINKYKYNMDIYRSIREEVAPGGWTFSDSGITDLKNDSHWYNAIMNYQINDKNKLVVEYAGWVNKSFENSLISQKVSTNAGNLYDNELLYKAPYLGSNNKIHLFYRGDINDKFNIEFNADASFNHNKENIVNEWNENDIKTGNTEQLSFVQNKKQTSGAYTADIILNNRFGKRHSITYGAEYAFLKDHIDMKSTNEEYGSSSYSMDSHYLKAFGEYRLNFGEKFSMTAGVSYMYNNINGTNYHNIIPKLSANYYDDKNGLGINLSFRYNNFAPRAGDLNDKTVTVVSPYEIRKGNANLTNSILTFTDLSVSYKGIGLGFWHQYLYKGFTSTNRVEIREDGTPLLVSMRDNLDRPANRFSLYASYLKEVGFWTPSLYVNLFYSTMDIRQQEGIYDRVSGLRFTMRMNNRFKLPKGFAVQLNGYYRSRGYEFGMKVSQQYSFSTVLEKQFFENKLNINLEFYGLVYNKYYANSAEQYGVYQRYSYSTKDERYLRFNIVWRFNNYKQIQRTKDNEYLNML